MMTITFISRPGLKKMLRLVVHTVMVFQSIFAAEDELQHGMKGTVCMSVILRHNDKGKGRASGIERRKASLFESLRCVCHKVCKY